MSGDTLAMREVPQSGLWSKIPGPSSGTGSERAKVASVADAEAPREPGSFLQSKQLPARKQGPCGGVRTQRALGLVLPGRACFRVLQDDPQRVEFLADPVGFREILPRTCGFTRLDPPLDFPVGNPGLAVSL
jgi:hypothetical protein